MTFAEEIAALGFALVQSNRGGTQRFAAKPNAYLQWWVHTYPDGTAEFTWEFELGAYLKERGFAISVQDELSLMLFPPADIRGPAEAAFVAAQVEAAEAMLASVDLLVSE
jgi:hypothetical protein